MIAQLHKWVQRDVQPLARKFMAAPIVRIETMSSYSCRNAYGRAHGRLSEHGRANAVDIASFVTAPGQAALVVSDWGPPPAKSPPRPPPQAKPPRSRPVRPPALAKPARNAAQAHPVVSVCARRRAPGPGRRRDYHRLQHHHPRGQR